MDYAVKTGRELARQPRASAPLGGAAGSRDFVSPIEDSHDGDAIPCGVGSDAVLVRAVDAGTGGGRVGRQDRVDHRRADYKQAHWGILIVDAKSGKTLYERNADRLFMPASVTKLYSCAAALAAIGPDHKFETPVYRRGEVKDGRLHGDLILVAQGDLTLGGRTTADGTMAFKDHDHIYANFPSGSESEVTDTDPLAGLTALAKQVKEAGITHIDGEVMIDDRLFAKSRGSGSGPDVVTPIVVNDNLIDILVTPADKVGERGDGEDAAADRVSFRWMCRSNWREGTRRESAASTSVRIASWCAVRSRPIAAVGPHLPGGRSGGLRPGAVHRSALRRKGSPSRPALAAAERRNCPRRRRTRS